MFPRTESLRGGDVVLFWLEVVFELIRPRDGIRNPKDPL